MEYQSDKDPIYTLHRYYLWATNMRSQFHATFKAYNANTLTKKKFDIRGFMFMSIWYGLLYVVVEGWQELKLQDAKIDELLKSDYLKLLRRYRNGVFHFQVTYFDPRFEDTFTEKDSAAWSNTLDDEFGRFFSDYFLSKL